MSQDLVKELYDRLPAVTAEVVGATNYVRDVVDGGDALLSACAHVQAYFSPVARVVYVHPDIGHRFAAFFRDSARRRTSISNDDRAERWQLGMLKSDLVTLIAAVLRGVGPADERLMQAEWDSLWRFPGGHALANGAPEGSARVLVDRIAAETGLATADERFAAAEPLRRHYIAQSELMAGITHDLAGSSGDSPAAELLAMSRLGSGELAVWSVARRYARLPEFGLDGALDAPRGWVELHQALARGLAGLTAAWSAADAAVVGVDEDQRLAGYWTGVVGRDVRTAVRRAKAGSGPTIDIGALATALADGAAAATAELDTQLDFLQGAWDALEQSGDGVEA